MKLQDASTRNNETLKELEMNKDILEIKPVNLPTYVYKLIADVALVHQGDAYKIKGYSFDDITVLANQPLRAGDYVACDSCYFGNENTEVIQHLCKKKILGGVEKELQLYYGCQIETLKICYLDNNSTYGHCGDGTCTIFIELSPTKTIKRFHELDERSDDLSLHQQFELEELRKNHLTNYDLEYWKKRIPDWDKKLECISEVHR
ncbi:MAG: hypothetical protein F6J92_09750 [Symploca sp. SIO1A3]|nr:hypothetical protein [Symploca sp. SIO1A3]